MADPIREFALEVRERGEAAVELVGPVAFVLITFRTQDDVIPEESIEYVVSQFASGDEADLVQRLVAVCRESSGELRYEALHYLHQWLAFFGGHTPLRPLVEAGLLTELPRRLERRRR